MMYWGTKSGSPYDNVANVGNVTSYVLSNLTPGTYYVALTAYNLDGLESSYSSEVSLHVKGHFSPYMPLLLSD